MVTRPASGTAHTGSADVHPAADPQAETTRIARPVDGVAIAPSRSRRHHLRLAFARQAVADDGAAKLSIRVELEPDGSDALLGRVRPVRRFVTTDGYELWTPEQEWSVDVASGVVWSQGIDIGSRQRGLRDLDLEARVYEVRARESFRSEPLGAGTHTVRLGPVEARATVSDEGVRLGFARSAAAERSWRARYGQPLLAELDQRWLQDTVVLSDAEGRSLHLLSYRVNDDTAWYVRDLTDAPAARSLTPPVTLALSLPTSFRQEDSSFYFRDIPLEPAR